MSSTREERALMLVSAAMEVLLRYGYRKTTLEDIASAAGVSRATVYNYFPSKEDLFRAIIVREIDRLRMAVESAVDPLSPPDVRLLAFIHARFQHLSAIRELYAMLLDVAQDVLPLVRQELLAFEAAQKDYMTALLEEGVESGRFRPVQCDLLAAALLAAVRGLTEEFMFQDSKLLAEGSDCLVSTLFTGLLVPGEAP